MVDLFNRWKISDVESLDVRRVLFLKLIIEPVVSENYLNDVRHQYEYPPKPQHYRQN